MSKFIEAADVLKRGALKYEQMMEAAKVLESIGSLEQAADGYKAEAEKANNLRQDALDALAAVKANIEQEKTQGMIDVSSAKERADNIIVMAQHDAASYKEKTMKEVEAEKALKTSSMSALIAKLNMQITALETQKRDLEGQIILATQRLSEVGDAAKAAENRLAKIKEAIAKLSAE